MKQSNQPSDHRQVVIVDTAVNKSHENSAISFKTRTRKKKIFVRGLARDFSEVAY